MSRAQIPDATAAEEQAIREDIDEWALIGGSSKSQQKLHIAVGDAPALCARAGVAGNVTDRDRERLVPKPVGVFPPGYHDLCRYCVQAWREGKHGQE